MIRNAKCCSTLSKLLAFMRSMQDCYQSAHWQAKGHVGYQDHLLFERLYDAMDDEIDVLAEKIIASCGSSYAGCSYQSKLICKYSCRIDPSNQPVRSMLAAEKTLQKLLKRAYDLLEQQNELSLGMDDFIMATASSHETAVYLLQQRLK